MKALKTLVLAVAAIGGAGAAQKTQAAPYGAVAIRNPSNVAIHYQFRWGDGEWKSICVYPGHVYHHWYPLDDDGRTPKPQIRFDWIGGDDRVTYRYFDLQTYATYFSDGGKRYVFRYSGDGHFLYLYAE